MEYEILTRNLKDSAAHSKLKLLKEGETFGVEKPGGEKRIHIGSMTDENKWDGFFFPNGGQSFNVIVSKIDLIKYMFEAKDEYFNPKQSYRLKISDYYDSLYEQTMNIPLELFKICFEKNTDNSRYYLTRPSNNEFSKNYKYIIDICLPIVTEYVFIRVKDDNSYIFYLKPEFRPNYITNEIITPDVTEKDSDSKYPLQQIFYGAPGTGKSNTIKREVDEKKLPCIRTTFHPDSDYSTFVGAYKPTMETIESKVVPVVVNNGISLDQNQGTYTESKITYKFVKQAFMKAYLGAWKKYADRDGDKAVPQFLIIEEINRGNCAQIFGDLFQLLDRGENRFSEYPIEADTDLQKEIERAFKEEKDGNDENPYKLVKDIEIEGVVDGYTSNYGATLSEDVQHGRVLLLPKNLYIWATMNTSDQSLFPIDSAFKRRWEWKYVRICEGKKEDGTVLNFRIKFNVPGEEPVDVKWWDFVKAINRQIEEATKSEDKKLGFFFCKPDKKEDGKEENTIISAETFVGKVVFYLWQDVFKDYGFKSNIFKRENGKKISFHDFYPEDMIADKDTNPEGIDLLLVKTFIQKVLDGNKEQPQTAAEA